MYGFERCLESRRTGQLVEACSQDQHKVLSSVSIIDPMSLLSSELQEAAVELNSG